MKVSCDNCGATYNIPDSKLVKEVNKATCRKCGHRMLIRRSAVVEASGSSFKGPEGDERTLIASSSALGIGPSPQEGMQAAPAPAQRPAPEPQAAPPPRFLAEPQPAQPFGADPRASYSTNQPAPQPRPAAAQAYAAPAPDARSMPGRGAWKEEIEEPVTPAVDYASPAPAPVAPRQEPVAARPPAQPSAARAAPGVLDLSGDLSVVMLAGLISALGAVLLASSGGSILLSFAGLFLALLGALTTVLMVITGSWGRKRSRVFLTLLVSLLLSTLLSGLLSLRAFDVVGKMKGRITELAATRLSTPTPEPVQVPVALQVEAPKAPAEPVTAAPDPVDRTTLGSLTASEAAVASAPVAAPVEAAPAAATTSAPKEASESKAQGRPAPAPASAATTSSRETTNSSRGTSTSSAPAASSSRSSSSSGASRAASTTSEAPPEASSSSTASADSETVKKVIAIQIRNNKNVKSCFADERKRSGVLPSITMQFTVQPAGSLTSISAAEAAMRGTDLEACLVSAISGISGTPFSGDPLRTSFPFRF
jgi:DNA-directed RNA polymerase subunit RPC12/RpoP